MIAKPDSRVPEVMPAASSFVWGVTGPETRKSIRRPMHVMLIEEGELGWIKQLTPLDRTTQRGRRDLYPRGFPASFCPAGSVTAIGCFSKIGVLFPSAPPPSEQHGL